MGSWRQRLMRMMFGVLATPLLSGPGPNAFAADPPPTVNLGSMLTLDDIAVVAQRLDAARTAIQPSLGATVYRFVRIPGSCRPRFRQIVAQHSELKSPSIPI